uniref:Uncharacterized protein n=1 Tax=Aegilops tauschii subsp. strangulata TaxID=200361 RepID=A0A453FZ32_AEGTS
MNMDEFMSNIWNVEEFQETIGGGPVGMQEAPAVGDGGSGGDGDARGSGLCRQGYFSLPPPLCQKTMEEVWDEINKEPRPVHAQPYVVRSSPQLPVQRMMGNGRKSFCVVMLPSGNKSAIDCSRQDACRWDHFILIFCYTLVYIIKI